MRKCVALQTAMDEERKKKGSDALAQKPVFKSQIIQVNTEK